MKFGKRHHFPFVQCHVEHIDSDVFHQLTNAEKVPYVDTTIAMVLIDLERQICKANGDESLSCLQTCCIALLAKNWEKLDMGEQENLIAVAK